MFARIAPHPANVTQISRLQMLDDAEFEAIVAHGQAVELPLELAEPGVAFTYEAPALAEVEAVTRAFRVATRGICAVTGEATDPADPPFVLWGRGAGLSLDPTNLLTLSPLAFAAFEDGAMSAAAGLSILVDLARTDAGLLERINPTRRLIVPDDPRFRPAADSLAFHRDSIFARHR
jgi:hypothetical protein